MMGIETLRDPGEASPDDFSAALLTASTSGNRGLLLGNQPLQTASRGNLWWWAVYPNWWHPLGLSLLLTIAGCATIQQPHRGHLDSENAQIRECARWYADLESAVSRSGVSDIAARRISGFPYLRIDRFFESIGDDARTDEEIRKVWLRGMLELDADGRRVEIDNLPAIEIERLAIGSRDELVARAQDCAARLSMIDLFDDTHDTTLGRRARVDDDYSTLKRGVGLYELTRLPFFMGVRNWQESVEKTFASSRDGKPSRAPVLRYQPPATDGYTRQEVSEILARADAHPLGLVNLSGAQLDRLFATYAPVLEIETTGNYDRIGRLFWGMSAAPQVDFSRPTVYRRLEYTRMENRSLLQLVYVAWMPERPPDHAFDLLSGQLDGIVWRVTLAPDGEPVIFDSIHPCGCYHMFFPTPRVEPLPAERRVLEWAFTPATLPAIAEGSRLVVSLQTRTHYIHNVWPGKPVGGTHYDFAEYDELRSLPLSGGGSRSIFGPDGLVPGTERGERFLFWPMGIKSAGAMRQSGSQATAFVGRRHFDDADIMAKRFRLHY